jgi:hypothetical protein
MASRLDNPKSPRVTTPTPPHQANSSPHWTPRNVCIGRNKACISNHVTTRPPRCRHPHRAARPITSCRPRPPSASRPAPHSSGTPGPLRSVTSTRTRPALARTATVTIPPSAPDLAMPDTIAEQLAHQQGGVIPARVPRTEHPGCEHADDTRPLLPPGHRHALPDHRPSHQRTRPSPPSTTPGGKPPGRRADTRGCTLDSAAHVKPEHPADAARPWPSVENRRCTPTVPGAPIPSAMRPWTPRHRDLQRYKVT